jgi:hypothetical protein
MSITSNNQITQTCASNPPLPRQMLKDVMQFNKSGLERVSECPIGIISSSLGCFLGEYQSRSCKCVKWCRGNVWAKGAVITGKCRSFCGCLCRGRVAPCHGCHCFLAHSMPFILCLIVFSFQGKVGGHCPGMVTSGDSVTHKHFMEMRRLACDETPFLLAMPPRATTLVW